MNIDWKTETYFKTIDDTWSFQAWVWKEKTIFSFTLKTIRLNFKQKSETKCYLIICKRVSEGSNQNNIYTKSLIKNERKIRKNYGGKIGIKIKMENPMKEIK